MPRAPGCGSSGGLQDKHYAHNRYAVLVIFQAMDAAGKDGAKDDGVWQGRYRSIRHFERHLHRNGTRIVKLFLHLSKEEQRKRFLARIDEPDKNWKLTPADIAERKYWQRYMKAYEACLAATSTGDAPWYGVPADDKGNARLIVSAILLELFRSLKLHYPRATPQRRRELQALRRKLALTQAEPEDGGR